MDAADGFWERCFISESDFSVSYSVLMLLPPDSFVDVADMKTLNAVGPKIQIDVGLSAYNHVCDLCVY